MAYANDWSKQPSPLSHSGNKFDIELLGTTDEILRKNALFPEKGYYQK